jgi:hypothetical protein
MAVPQLSGTYNYQVIEVELLIREAFERIGIAGEMIEAQKLDSARRSINFLLMEWMNDGANLWALQKDFLYLTQGKYEYTLPIQVRNVVQTILRTYTRQLNGIAAASTGIAATTVSIEATIPPADQDKPVTSTTWSRSSKSSIAAASVSALTLLSAIRFPQFR